MGDIKKEEKKIKDLAFSYSLVSQLGLCTCKFCCEKKSRLKLKIPQGRIESSNSQNQSNVSIINLTKVETS